jgi:6,7-dimethyl-8-ribityllumazine synthase
VVQKKYKNKILIISSFFYKEISNNLLSGVKGVLQLKKMKFDIIKVDGSLEIPFLLEKYKFDYVGYIILGCVIKGETDHYDIVKNITLNHIYKIAYENVLPLTTAILTVRNLEQAIERSRIDKKNLGGSAALKCIDLINKLND